jgi:hypothetical protein
MNLDNSFKKHAIHQEIEASFEYIRVGLVNLREQKSGVSNNHVTLQLLASGFERILKTLLVIKYKYCNGSFPELVKTKEFFIPYDGGHGIEKMLIEMVEYSPEIKGYDSIPMIREDMAYLEDDNFMKFINILTEFSKFGRYYYIDTIVSGGFNNARNCFDEFKYFIGIQNQDVDEKVHSYPEEETIKINNTIICIEKGARAISRFFSHGFDGLGQEYFGGIIRFLLLKDEDLGKLDYPKTIYPIDNYLPMAVESAKFSEIALKSRSKILQSSSYSDWPFKVDSVIVYNTDGRHFFVLIDNKVFGLTGKSCTHHSVPFQPGQKRGAMRQNTPLTAT